MAFFANAMSLNGFASVQISLPISSGTFSGRPWQGHGLLVTQIFDRGGRSSTSCVLCAVCCVLCAVCCVVQPSSLPQGLQESCHASQTLLPSGNQGRQSIRLPIGAMRSPSPPCRPQRRKGSCPAINPAVTGIKIEASSAGQEARLVPLIIPKAWQAFRAILPANQRSSEIHICAHTGLNHPGMDDFVGTAVFWREWKPGGTIFVDAALCDL